MFKMIINNFILEREREREGGREGGREGEEIGKKETIITLPSPGIRLGQPLGALFIRTCWNF